ncbi:MAG: InlB B-repeat-containing protein [Acholeplasmatales bacterium]|nr:InlB B-repeat-containing protein [Acholeplasmatales bacterium]
MKFKKIVKALAIFSCSCTLASCSVTGTIQEIKNKVSNAVDDDDKNDDIVKQNTYFEVTFNTNGGSEVAVQKVKKDDKVIMPTNPTKEGYSFAGWYLESSLSNKFNFDAAINYNLTLYAKWNKENETKCKVTFNTEGGSIISDKEVVTESTINAPNDPIRSGCVFAGWYTDYTYNNKYDFNTEISNDITLYAKWIVSQKAALSIEEYANNEVLSNSIKLYQSLKNVSDFNLYYIENISITVTDSSNNYKCAEGFFGDVKPEGYLKKNDSINWSFEFPSNICDLSYWEKKKFDYEIYTAYNAIVLPNEFYNFNVEFDLNDGSKAIKQTVKYGTKLSQTIYPSRTRTGYTFAGWYTDSSLTTKYDLNSPVKNDLKLYAKWTINKYKITFNSNGGSNILSETVEYGDTVYKPTNPTKSCYSFAGWYTDSSLTKEFDFNTPVANEITLFAKWNKEAEYSVTFVTNGGTNVSSQTVINGQKVTKPSNPTKSGYTFAGWYKESSLTNKYDFDTKVTSNIKLYAAWTKNSAPIVQNNGISCGYVGYEADTKWNYLKFDVRFTNNTGEYVSQITELRIDVYVDGILRASGIFNNINIKLRKGSSCTWTLNFYDNTYDKSFWPYLSGSHNYRVIADCSYSK